MIFSKPPNRKSSQSGFIEIIVILLLFIGVIVGVYLTQNPTNILPKAQENPEQLPTADKPIKISCMDNPVLPPSCQKDGKQCEEKTENYNFYYYKWDAFCGKALSNDNEPEITCGGAASAQQASEDCMRKYLEARTSGQYKKVLTCAAIGWGEGDSGNLDKNIYGSNFQAKCRKIGSAPCNQKPFDSCIVYRNSQPVIAADRGVNPYDPKNFWCYGFVDKRNQPAKDIGVCMILDTTVKEPGSKLGDPQDKQKQITDIQTKFNSLKSKFKTIPSEAQSIINEVTSGKRTFAKALEFATGCQNQIKDPKQRYRLDFTQQDGKSGFVEESKSRCEIAVVRAYKKMLRAYILTAYYGIVNHQINGCMVADLGHPDNFMGQKSGTTDPKERVFVCNVGQDTFYTIKSVVKTLKDMSTSDQVIKYINQNPQVKLSQKFPPGSRVENYRTCVMSTPIGQECKITRVRN
ncbi:hypothetical protein HYS93_01255 [Candidatus Daviesbacteria bacterium]|nr:hypothetical protein [Candidatus Daviesbacteria bacterium]